MPDLDDDGALDGLDEVRQQVRVEVAVPAGSAPTVPLSGEVVRWQAEAPRARPISAAWVIDRDERRSAGRWLLVYVGHVSAFHAVRVPVYLGRSVRYAPRGAGRAAWAWYRWALDAEGAPLRRHAVEHGKTAEYMALSRQRDQRVRARLYVSGAVLVSGGALAGGLTVEYGPIVPWALVVLAVLLLGWNGRRLDRPFIESAVLTAPGARRLTPDTVIRACIAARLCKDDDPITFVARGIARDGEGFLAVFDLPFGQKAATAIKRREDIAAGLDVDEVRVFVDRVRGDTGSARRVSLWVADRDPYAQLPPVTPLASAKSVDF